MRRAERIEAGELDDGFDLALEGDGKHDDVRWRGHARARHDLEIFTRRVLHENVALLVRALPDEPLTQTECERFASRRDRVAREEIEQWFVFLGFVEIEDARLRVDERREFGEDERRDGADIFLTLQHAGKAREIGFEPVLLLILPRRIAQITDHFVDVFGQRADLALGADLDGSREIALGHGGRDFADRANLRRELGRELIDVVGEIFPETRGAGNLGLAAEFAFETDFACDGRHLICEGTERIDHAVDGVGEFGDLTLGFEAEFAFEIAVGDAGDDAGDPANLLREIARHAVDGVGEIFPRPRDARHGGLATQLPFGADFARDARHFRCETI